MPEPPNAEPVIVATPAETPVARPVEEIVTTAGLLLFHVAVALGYVLPVESVAVALLHSYAEPSHERSLRFLGLPHLDHDKPRCTDRRDVALQWLRPISFTGLGIDTENLVDG